MTPELQHDLMAALERPHRLGTIGGELEEQLAHCASFSSVLGDVTGHEARHGRGVDLGTGGGLPGVALAAMWPSMAWTLVDMRTARADEVERTILRLGLADRVEVYGSEAQLLGHRPAFRETYDVGVARAFGPPSITAECAAGLVRIGGVLVVSEPPANQSDSSERWDAAGLRSVGFDEPRTLERDGYQFAVMHKIAAAPVTVPRLPPRSSRGWYQAS